MRFASAYEQQGQQLQAARTQAAAEHSQIAKMQQEQKWVVAGDMLSPEGGYQLSALNQYVPKLQGLRDVKVVVYGYTDNKPVGSALQRAGIANNVDLSSWRADHVVAYLTSQGVNPNIISAKGFGDTDQSPRMTHRKAARKTAASKSCWKDPESDPRVPDLDQRWARNGR